MSVLERFPFFLDSSISKSSRVRGSRLRAGIQLQTTNEPLLLNLTSLLFGESGSRQLRSPSCCFPRTPTIFGFRPTPSKALAAPIITTLPTWRSYLRMLGLRPSPRDPAIAAVVFGMFLATNRNALQQLCANSPLAEEANSIQTTKPTRSFGDY